MAEYDEDPNRNYTGFRYLMDTKTQRQYALEFVNGTAKLPLRVFNPEKPNGDALAPGETIYAIDDEQQIGRARDARGEYSFINAVVYKITAKKDGYSFSYLPVSYDAVGQRGSRVTLELSPDAQNDPDFPGMPVRFDVDPGAPSLPTHHATGKALLARAAIRKLSSAFNTPAAQQPYRENPNWKVSDAKLEKALSDWCTDLTQQAKDGTLDPIIGRDDEVAQTIKVLNRRKQASLCFTGDAGSGKTAMFRAIAQRLAADDAKGKLPQSLRGAKVLSFKPQRANEGAKYRGDFEAKVGPIIEGLLERKGTFRGKKIILAIDEIHSQLTAGMAEGGTNMGQMMKELMQTDGVAIIGATTDKEYKKYIEQDDALARRFEKLRLSAPDAEQTIAILKGLWPLTRKKNNIAEDLSEEDLQYIVTMTNRYAPQEGQPSKSENVVNMAASSAEVRAAESGETRIVITRDDILDAVSRMSNLPKKFLNQDDAQRFLDLKRELPKEVLGQPGIAKIPQGLIGARAGLAKPDQPWGCFVLQGPTGTGKTETCKALARYLFGDENSVIRLDMGQYSEKHTVANLIGAPPGYIGHDTAEPALTEKIRQKPFSILLLDEIEKAHPDVFNTLLPILEHGKMTDNKGNTVLFNNVIVVMTSNLGAEKVQKLIENNGNVNKMSLDNAQALPPEELKKRMEQIYAESVKSENRGPFKPEMINRINALGGFITFQPLGEDVIAKLTVREIAATNKRLNSSDGANIPGATLEVSDAVMKQLAKEGYNPAMGARPLQTVVREKVVNPFSAWILEHADEVRAFVAQHGAARIVVNSLELKDGEFVNVPKLEPPAGTTATAANDDTPTRFVKKASGFKP